MARLRNEEMPTVSVDLHDIFDVNPSQLSDNDYLNGNVLIRDWINPIDASWCEALFTWLLTKM